MTCQVCQPASALSELCAVRGDALLVGIELVHLGHPDRPQNWFGLRTSRGVTETRWMTRGWLGFLSAHPGGSPEKSRRLTRGGSFSFVQIASKGHRIPGYAKFDESTAMSMEVGKLRCVSRHKWLKKSRGSTIFGGIAFPTKEGGEGEP